MPAPSKKSFEAPDERIDLPGITADVIEMADATISRTVFQPGTHCPQISYEGEPVCNAHHAGYAVDGMLHVEMQNGSVLEVGPNEVFDVPPRHDGMGCWGSTIRCAGLGRVSLLDPGAKWRASPSHPPRHRHR